MVQPKKVVRFQATNVFILPLATFLLIATFWLILVALTSIGFPFPEIALDKFFDLGFFSISIFGIIVFLTMVPFQTVEGKLSPIFYSKIFNAPAAHFGLYVLMFSSIVCFVVIALQQALNMVGYLSQLFIALVMSIVFAILFHRFWVLRCLYQPYIVYKYIKTLEWDESAEEIWLELFECAFKAIKQGRVSDAKNLIDLMAHIYNKCPSQERHVVLREDIMSLYAAAQESRPIARSLEEKWPFCIQNKQ
ncbi:hypothetical protein PHSC3_000417 [Chlamydiales bacterium STE3]|nr:hypothetical protein PHSC3_000417 [Chlamydiales bacterium STE3]